MVYNISGSRRVSDGIKIVWVSISGWGRHNKIHNKSYNITTAKDSGGEHLKVFEVDNTVSNLADKFNRGMESIIHYAGSEYDNSK